MNDDELLAKYGLTADTKTPVMAGEKLSADDLALLAKHGIVDVKDEPKKKSSWWQGQAADSSYEGTAKKLGIGLVRGAKDILDTGAHGLANAASYVADKVLPESIAGGIRRSAESTIAADKQGRDQYDKEYPSSESLIPNATDVGRFSGQVLGTAPLMPVRAMQGIAGVAKALPAALPTGGQVAAPIANRLAASAGQGALGGAVFNAATSSSNDKSLSENVGEGALTGALAGPLVTGAAVAGKGLASKVAGSISPERAELARKASDHGIDLDAGQVSTSQTFKKYNQVSGWLPFSGAQAATEKQTNQFTRAIARTFGEDTANITPEVLKNAKTRIGNDYDTVAANTTIKGDTELAKDLAKVVQHANEVISDPNQLANFHKQLDNIIAKFKNGEMTGEQWQAMRKTGEPLSTIANANRNTTLGQAVKGLIVSMDGAFNRSAPPEMQSLLKQANSQYKAMKTVKKLADSDAEGHVSPLKLMSKIVNSPYGGKEGAGKLGELADIGRAFFPTPSDSGTPLGEAIINKLAPTISSPVTGIAAGIGSLVGGATIANTAEGVAGGITNRLIRKGLNSAKVRNSIIENAEGANYGSIDKFVGKTIPYSSNLLKDKDVAFGGNGEPTRITVRPKTIKLPVALE